MDREHTGNAFLAHEICMLRSLGKATSDIGVCLSQG